MHLTSIEQIDRETLEKLFQRADYWKRIRTQKLTTIKPLQGRLLTNLFYEPSTRTASSFFAAASFLGASVNQITNVAFSSVSKGETFEDTILTLAQYSDGIILRHPEKGYADLAASVSPVPIINAGDGTGEHPTQTLLDLYTIYSELGRIDDLAVAMVGDLKNGRTVHSLTKAFAKYETETDLIFISPEELKMPEEYCEVSKVLGIQETEDMTSAMENNHIDVLYMTRIQKERFNNQEDYKRYHGCYELTPKEMKLMPDESCVLHPLPRVGEISSEVDHDPRAAYFRQVKNGMFMRMAILEALIS